MRKITSFLAGLVVGLSLLGGIAQAATILFPTGGGTGWGNLQQYSVLFGNGTARLATTSPGTSGNVLTSNGPSAFPTFKPAGSTIIPVSTSSSETSGYFPAWTTTNGTPAKLSGTSLIFSDGTHIGIGNPSPTQALTVNGAILSNLELIAPTSFISSYFPDSANLQTFFNNSSFAMLTLNGVTTNVGVSSTTPWKELSVGTGNTGTFAISTSTAGCAQFAATGEVYSTGTTCGTGTGSAYNFPLTGNATSSTVGFTGGIFVNSSTTISGALHLPYANGELSVFGNLVSSGATTTAGTGLTYSGNAFNVNTSQNITNLTNLNTAGLVKTTGTGGALSIASAGTDYQAPVTLTTTGTSGAATFVANTLNIPQYANTTYTGAFPITLTGTVFGFGGLSTTTNLTQGFLPYVTGVNTFGQVATTTASCAGTVSCTPFTVIGASPITLTGSGGGGGGSGTVGTSTNETPGALAYWTSNSATPALLGKVSTTTTGYSGPFTITGTLGALVGGSNSTINWTGLATTSQPASSNILTSNGGAGVYGTATSSIGAGTGLTFSGTAGAQVGGTNGTYSVNTTQNITTLSNLSSGTVNSSSGVLYNTGTSTPTVTAPITYSGTLGQFIGGVSGTFACTSASAGVTGCLTGTDFNTFTAKQNSLGTPTPGFVAAFVNGAWSGVATTTFSSGLAYAAGNVTNTGVLSTIAGSGISVSGATGNVTIGNTGILSENCSSGISCSTVSGATAFTNTGVTSIVAGTNITISGATGAVTVNAAGGSSFGYPFPVLGLGTTSPIMLLASTTIGGGTAITGLTINGSATTTGNMAVLNSLVVGGSAGMLPNTQPGGLFLYNTNQSGASPYLLMGGNAGGDTDYWIGRTNNNNTAPDQDYLQFGSGLVPGTSPFLTLDGNRGTFGIGTTSPSFLLSLATSTAPQLSLSDGSLTSNQWSFRTAGGTLYIGTSSPSTFATSTTPTLILQSTASTMFSVGSSTPWATLSVTPNQNFTGPLFALASTSITGKAVFYIDANGRPQWSGAAPTLTSCGTSPTMYPGSNDTVGYINVGSGAVTACTMTFKSTYVNTPFCSIIQATSTGTSVLKASSTPTTLNMLFSTTIGGMRIGYKCDGISL